LRSSFITYLMDRDVTTNEATLQSVSTTIMELISESSWLAESGQSLHVVADLRVREKK